MSVNGDSDLTRQAEPADSTERIGPYHLLQMIGEGGMGEVWVAEQREPIRRTVAIKIIKLGMDSRQVVARFNAERQALAVMDHPAIAKVFDAGTTEQGRPYFVMEYVKGEPITDYCDRQRLHTAARLSLFVRVCEGVQHAHQKGIIHRDLKPSNVLVSIQEDQPAPKIIDFGIAKATAHHLTEQTVFTELGVLIGTPEYMSPEQAEMTGLDIDTRTDIYSLGVLLYELLTGTLPFDRELLRAKALDEIRRTIRETDPPRPSTRITQSESASTDAAKNRLTEPARLASELRGDLDWITMRALEKDRTRRYDTAAALANDVQRHLQDQPVVAGPPSASYRTRKFVRRHRLGVVAAAALVGILVAFAATMAVQAQRIARERDRANREAEVAQRVSAFLVGLFEMSKPNEASANSVTAREILDQGAERIERELQGQPEIRAALMGTIGEAYHSLGLYRNAEALEQQTLRLLQQVYGPRSDQAARAMVRLATTLEREGKYADAERLARDALAFVQHGPRKDETLGRAFIALAWICLEQGKTREAELAVREGCALYERIPETSDRDRAECSQTLGAILLDKAELSGAERAFGDSLKYRRRAFGSSHPLTLAALGGVAAVWLRQGKLVESEAAYHDIVEAARRTLGPEHTGLATPLNNLGAVLFLEGKYGQAEKAYSEALAIDIRALGERHPRVAIRLKNIGQVLSLERKYPEAERVLTRALDIERSSLGDDHRELGLTLTYLANSRCRAGKASQAEKPARQALRINREQLGPNHPRTKESEGALGCSLATLGRFAEAEPLLVSYATALQGGPDVEGDFKEVGQQLAAMYQRWGKLEKAAEWRTRSSRESPAAKTGSRN